MIAIVEFKRDNHLKHNFEWKFLTPQAFQKLFERDQYLVETYDRKQLRIHEDWDPEAPRTDINSFFKSEKNPFPKVTRTWISVADIWLRHPLRHTRKHTVCDPANRLKNDKHVLNTFSGFAIQEPKVRERKEWWRIRFYQNHIKYTLCDSEQSYLQFQFRIAFILQKMRKMGVAIGIGGDEGSGKSGIILKLKEIIGEAHFAEIHDPNDACGEFNAAVIVSYNKN